MFRNFAVYQQLDTSGPLTKATWIFVGLPGSLKDQLDHVVQGRELAPFGAVLWHLAFLVEASRGWREYINYLETRFQEIVRKTFFILQWLSDAIFLSFNSRLTHCRRLL